ncbi:hypothetical protein V6N11_015114 [Hibiscus sabdariffa]|uniref:Secreted protein n=1 Tax=Hibiscus sabdariffa TaxID=183260 RepID=A0ABR2TRC6_9ROSI
MHGMPDRPDTSYPILVLVVIAVDVVTSHNRETMNSVTACFNSGLHGVVLYMNVFPEHVSIESKNSSVSILFLFIVRVELTRFTTPFHSAFFLNYACIV